MSDGKHLATHPDENLLSAFAEDSLTPKERENVLGHLSTCTRCRDVVFLAQAASTEGADQRDPTPVPALSRRRWFSWGSLAAGGAVAALLIAGPIVVYRYRNRAIAQPVASSPVSPPAVPAAGGEVPLPDAAHTLRTEPVPRSARSVPRRGAVTGLVGQAEIKGSVVDRSGAGVPGASVSARALSTGKIHSAVTDKTGQFDLAALPSGSYEVQVQALGFNRFSEAVTVQSSERASVDAKLDVGSASETVSVSAANGAVPAGVIGGLVGGSGTAGGKITGRDAYSGTTAPAAAPVPPQPQASVSAGAAPVMNGPLASGMVVSRAEAAATFPVKDGVVQHCIGTECVARILPLGAKAVSAAGSGRTVMAVDSGGNLFLSNDQGEHWEQAKVQWQGKAVNVGMRSLPDKGMVVLHGDAMLSASAKRAAASSSATVFDLTNDKGQVWVSLDEGRIWVAK